MNETLEVIKKRRSIRKYGPKQVGDKELEAIMEAAIYAPSAMNPGCEQENSPMYPLITFRLTVTIMAINVNLRLMSR